MTRRRWGLVAAAGALTMVVSACGGGGSPSAAPTTATTTATSTTTTSTTSTSTTPSTAATTTTTTAPTPTTLSAVGLVVDGTGSTLTPPAAPTAKPYSSGCGTLIDTGFRGECTIVTSPAGTIAAVEESQYSPASTEQFRDLVYRRSGRDWYLILRRVRTSGEYSLLYSASISAAGPVAVFVVPAPNNEYANEIDLVAPDGELSLYRDLHGGFATATAGGPLVTYTPAASGGYDVASISFSSGDWRITSVHRESQTQAQAEQQQSFNDPSATPAEDPSS